MEANRIEVREQLSTWDKYKFDGDLDKIIKSLQEFSEQHKRFHKIEIDEETSNGYYGDSWTDFVVTGVRWETDDEMSKRIEENRSVKGGKKICNRKKS